MLKLMYITNQPEVAKIAEAAGVDWILVDMEFIGKDLRQGGLDTVMNHHTIDDVQRIKKCLNKSKVVVRINPIHEEIDSYYSSEQEIEETINSGADIIMLPFFKTIREVHKFLMCVRGRAKTCLLVETPEAVLLIDEIIKLKGIDFIHLGLNDLHLALGQKFMFELLADGTVERLGNSIKKQGIPFGFGGIATLEGGIIPGSTILKEHYRLGSSMVIISRSFCNSDKINNLDEIRRIFNTGIADIRKLEKEAEFVKNYFSDNHNKLVSGVQKIINEQ